MLDHLSSRSRLLLLFWLILRSLSASFWMVDLPSRRNSMSAFFLSILFWKMPRLRAKPSVPYFSNTFVYVFFSFIGLSGISILRWVTFYPDKISYLTNVFVFVYAYVTRVFQSDFRSESRAGSLLSFLIWSIDDCLLLDSCLLSCNEDSGWSWSASRTSKESLLRCSSICRESFDVLTCGRLDCPAGRFL